MIEIVEIPNKKGSEIKPEHRIYTVVQKSPIWRCFFFTDVAIEFGKRTEAKECLRVNEGINDPAPTFWQSLRGVEPEGRRCFIGDFWLDQIDGNYVPFSVSCDLFVPKATSLIGYLKRELPDLDFVISLSRKRPGDHYISVLPDQDTGRSAFN